jgi:hypothetical protein
MRFRPGSPFPVRIEQFTVRRRAKRAAGTSSVFRLPGVGDNAANVIAKRGRADNVAFELLIYEKFLAQPPITSLQVIGSLIDEADGAAWLFVEDAGEEAFVRSSAEHRRAVAQWPPGFTQVPQPCPHRSSCRFGIQASIAVCSSTGSHSR